MSLTPTERRRYARHTLLPEIGAVGQERLCATTASVNSDADRAAAMVARAYLERAGVSVAVTTTDEAAVVINVAAPSVVDRVGPNPLRYAASTLAGAFAAAETIKTLVGAGVPAELPATFRLIVEEA